MAQHGARILVADNDCGMRQIISYVVRGLSHEAVVVSDGIEAIEALRTDRPFALLIVDIVMPRLSGRSLIRQLAAEKRAERIIVVSGSCSSENMVELARLGVIEFVRKPFGREELELAIVNALAATPSDAANGSTVEDVANDEPLEEAVETLVKDACAGHVALPSASKSFARILSMHADPELARESVFELIRASVAIESHVFAQANGATYGEQEPTADIDVALDRIGDRGVVSLTLAALQSQFYDVETPWMARILLRSWNRTLFSAAFVRELAFSGSVFDPEDAYLVGLFANVGEPVFFRTLAKRLPPAGLEPASMRAVTSGLARSHEALGGSLLALWELPNPAQLVARYHHGPPAASVEFPAALDSLVHWLNLAEHRLAARGKMQSPTPPSGFTEQASMDLAGISAADVERAERRTMQLLTVRTASRA